MEAHCPSTSDAAVTDQRQKLFSRLALVSEATEHGASDRLTSRLLNSSHHHAKVARSHEKTKGAVKK